MVDKLLRRLQDEGLITDTTTDFTIGEEHTEWDLWETTNRIFVSDLPWHQRFLIWLFPRMYHLEEYNP